MKNTRMLIMAGIVAMSLPAMASAAAHTNEGYLVDAEGDIVRSGTGLCWHTIEWTPAMAVAGCDPVASDHHAAASVATTPIAKPKPAPAQAKIQPRELPRKVNISAEDLFKFNRSVLSAKGRAKLDNFVSDLKGVNYDTIDVTGYTDRIGGAKYNQRLSLRRAYAVRRYLEIKGIPADRISVAGKGKSQPVTRYTDCRGMTKAKTIACLQPDRRAEIAVYGTKDTVANQKLGSLSNH